jgi:8-amino-7-oxononanoate synthase
LTELERRLAEQQARGLYRTRIVLDSPQSVEVEVDGMRLLSFCSNDYLGLANDPRVVAAFRHAAARYGVGAGASHLVSGHSRAHQLLEEELAEWVGSERTLLFSTGYMANMGIVTALAGRGTRIYEDRLNHASLIDAARLSRAKVTRYPHLAVSRLATLTKGGGRNALITTDGVFSMDGDLAPLPELLRVAREAGARLLVDDAHGFGVMGRTGRGSLEYWGLEPKGPVVLMCTLGKALGTFGAFVAAETNLIEHLIQAARTYTYTTALPPAVAEATRASLKILREEPERREHLRALVECLRKGTAELGLALGEGSTPIQPLILGSAERATAAASALRARGLLVPAIRPPTVPAGGARLRITLSAAHRMEHVERLLEALQALPPEDHASAS